MSAIIIVAIDGLFCESSLDIPSTEPDAYAMRWYASLYEGSNEQFVMVCDSPNTPAVDTWLRNLGVKFSTLVSTGSESDTARIESIFKFVGAQHAKIVLYIGTRFYDCNQMADRGVPSLRYLPPNQNNRWEPDHRSAWVKAIEKQEA
jgi:hypothetical protein